MARLFATIVDIYTYYNIIRHRTMKMHSHYRRPALGCGEQTMRHRQTTQPETQPGGGGVGGGGLVGGGGGGDREKGAGCLPSPATAGDYGLRAQETTRGEAKGRGSGKREGRGGGRGRGRGRDAQPLAASYKVTTRRKRQRGYANSRIASVQYDRHENKPQTLIRYVLTSTHYTRTDYLPPALNYVQLNSC